MNNSSSNLHHLDGFFSSNPCKDTQKVSSPLYLPFQSQGSSQVHDEVEQNQPLPLLV